MTIELDLEEFSENQLIRLNWLFADFNRMDLIDKIDNFIEEKYGEDIEKD